MLWTSAAEVERQHADRGKGRTLQLGMALHAERESLFVDGRLRFHLRPITARTTSPNTSENFGRAPSPSCDAR